MSRHARCWFTLAICSFMALSPPFALGQESAGSPSEAELQEAREWFGEGVAESEAGRYAVAVNLFRRVLAVRASPQVRYNLAYNLLAMSLIREADEHVQMLLEAPDLPAALRSDATDLRLQMSEVGGRLALNVAGAAPGTYDLELDGQILPSSALGQNLRVRAGDHVINVIRGDQQLLSEVVRVTAGQSESIVLRVTPTPRRVAEQAIVPSPPPPEEDEEDGGSVLESWPFWVVVAVVVVGGVTLGLVLSGGEETVGDPVLGNFQPGLITWE